MTDNSALPEIGALVERLRAIPVWMVGEMTPGWQEHGTTAYEAADTLATLLQSLTDLTRERDEARARVEELQHDAEIFDEEHADQNRMVDRIADLIGLPHDQELDTTAFELWFSTQREAVAAAWDAAGRKAHERLYPKNERADWTDIAAHNAYMANEVRLALFEEATALRTAASSGRG